MKYIILPLFKYSFILIFLFGIIPLGILIGLFVIFPIALFKAILETLWHWDLKYLIDFEGELSLKSLTKES